MLPLYDDVPTRRRSWLTLALIVANLVVFALVQPHGAASEQRFAYERAAVPCELTEGRPATYSEVVTGECGAPAVRTVRGVAPAEPIFPDKNVYLAVLVSMFLHGSWLHVLGNMLFLWIFGNNVEDRFGPVVFAVLYVLLGVIATAGYWAVNSGSTVPLLGASGAIAGVMGAYLVLWPRARVLTLVFYVIIPLPAALVLGGWFVLQFFTGSDSGVAWMAHVTGFVAGILVGALSRAISGPPPGPAGGSRPRRPAPYPGWSPPGERRGAPPSGPWGAPPSGPWRPPPGSWPSTRGAPSVATSSARSAATCAGAGRGTTSPPRTDSGDVTPDSTSAKGHPRAVASAPSVDGRSPTTTPTVPKRRRTRPTVGASGLPATSGSVPEAVATAATIAPAPGSRPSAVG